MLLWALYDPGVSILLVSALLIGSWWKGAGHLYYRNRLAGQGHRMASLSGHFNLGQQLVHKSCFS